MPAEAVARSLTRCEADFGLTELDLVSELGFDSGAVNLEAFAIALWIRLMLAF